MDAILAAFERDEISKREAIERVLYHSEFGGNRDDAKVLVEEWCVYLDQRYGALS